MAVLSRWIFFNIFVLVAVALDLGVFNRRPHKISMREAAVSSVVFVTLAGMFGVGVFWSLGRQPALEFFTGYLIEKALSIDNLFLFLVIFRAFHVDDRVQHRLLAWGVLGALIMRGIMIALGAALIERYAWVMYIFGAFLVYAGIHMLVAKEKEAHPEENKIFQFARRHLRVTRQYMGEHFFVRLAGKLFATPLFIVLLIVEITDITLAFDSIPAIFGITHDPFIVYTSNVFAILGLRALYFLLAGALGRLRYLTVGLSFVLVFIGGKMIGDPWVHVPTVMSLGVVAGILLIALVASLLAKPLPQPAEAVVRRQSGDGKVDGDNRDKNSHGTSEMTNPISVAVEELCAADKRVRCQGATRIYRDGRKPADAATKAWFEDSELSELLLGAKRIVNVGLAVGRETFARIREANGSPELATVPPDQDAEEFELHFEGSVTLDILTTKDPNGAGAIAKFLQKFGEGVQQVEFCCKDVARATLILKDRFGLNAIYPTPRLGAGGATINFFLVSGKDGAKVLIELYQLPA